MLKTILKYLTIAVLGAIVVTYFISVSSISASASRNEIVRRVDILLKDSARIKFLDKDVVRRIYYSHFGNPEGLRVNSLKLGEIENYLKSQSTIKDVQVTVTRSGVLRIEIEQRQPVLRIETLHGSYYADQTAYIYPIENLTAVCLPIVSGNIPIKITDTGKGLSYKDKDGWMKEMIALVSYISSNPFWNSMIEQMYVNGNGDLELYTQVGNAKIIFGNLHSVQAKFEKLMAFYKQIAPVWGWERYKEINLKYNNQIVCVLNKKN